MIDKVFKDLWDRINQPRPLHNGWLRLVLTEALAGHVSKPDETDRFVIAALLLGPLPSAEVGLYWRNHQGSEDAPERQDFDSDDSYGAAYNAFYAQREAAEMECLAAADEAIARLIDQDLVQSYDQNGVNMVRCTELVQRGGFVHD